MRIALTWHARNYGGVYAPCITRMPGESYGRRLRSLFLRLCYVFRALITSLVCWFCTSALDLVLFLIREDIKLFITDFLSPPPPPPPPPPIPYWLTGRKTPSYLLIYSLPSSLSRHYSQIMLNSTGSSAIKQGTERERENSL